MLRKTGTSGRQGPSVGHWWSYLSGDVELSDSLFRWLNSANSWRWTVWLDPGLWLVGWYDWLIAWHVPTVVDRFKYFSWAMAAICPLISNPELWLVEISFWSETERSLSVVVVAPFPAACRSRSVLMIGPFSLVGMFELNKELSLNFGLVFRLGLGLDLDKTSPEEQNIRFKRTRTGRTWTRNWIWSSDTIRHLTVRT